MEIELRLVERVILLESHGVAPACESSDGALVAVAVEAQKGDLLVAEGVGVRMRKKVQ